MTPCCLRGRKVYEECVAYIFKWRSETFSQLRTARQRVFFIITGDGLSKYMV
jgi:hypothetical protein